MKFIYPIIIYLLSIAIVEANTISKTDRRLQGVITHKSDKAALVGVNIYLPELKKGAVTDSKGKYEIANLPAVKTTIQISYLGHQTIVSSVDLSKIQILDFEMDEANAKLDEVVVTAFTGNTLAKRSPSPISKVSQTELLQQSSTNIIDAIAQQPGVSQISTGSGISKPVIRGLGFNRVVIVNDGIRQEGQQWGDEHGIEIDGQTVNSVEIMKGPASLIYGSDAMAGVIHFQPAPTLPEGKTEANLFSEYQTNNGLINYSANVAGNKKGFVWNWRYSDKWAHAYKNKYDGYVYNSGFQERAVTALMGLNGSWGYSHLTLSYYKLTPGIVEGERDEQTGEFVKPTITNGEADETIATQSDYKSYKHQMPYQKVGHYKAVLNNTFFVGQGTLKAIVGYQQNQRKEFEDVVNPTSYALYFKMHTLNYDLRYTLPQWNDYKVVAGINGMYQSSKNKGEEFLIPEYNLFDMGVFAVASRNFGKLDVSGGLRYDYRNNKGKALYLDDEEKFAAFNRSYNSFSGSIGLAYQISDQWFAKLNLSKGFRAPNISELGSNGAHEGSVRYEKGNINLRAENSWQADLGVGYSSALVSGEAALFTNRINNYIFSHKLLDSDGSDLMTDGYKTYQYTSGTARIVGGEISIDIHPMERIHFQNSFSYVSSTQLNQPDSTKYLPFTPAPKLTSDLRFELIRHGKTMNNTYLSVGVECNFKQDKVYAAFDTESPTPSYTLLNASFGTDFVQKGRTWATLVVTANNITDRAYQNHLSRLKYAALNQVTNREGVFNMGRNFGIKLLIPINF